jgi:hypothetical protein
MTPPPRGATYRFSLTTGSLHTWHNPDHSEAAHGQARLADHNAFVGRRHGAIKLLWLLDHPGAIILLRPKPATEVVVSHFPSGRWPILGAVSKPGKAESEGHPACGRAWRAGRALRGSLRRRGGDGRRAAKRRRLN